MFSIVSPTANPWAFHTHPDTWFVIVLGGFSYWYALRRIGPRVLGGRIPVATRRQVMWFCAGLLTLELAGDWPLHDLAENYLYSAHMVQHLLISLVAPPMLLLGTPTWLVRWILRKPWSGGTVRVMARPLVAGVMFNFVIAISHAPFYVNGTLEHHFLHFWAHLLLFVVSMFMWFPVINKLEEFPSLSGFPRMIYMFVMSILPNVPAAFLLLATGVVYKFYATVPHPFAGLGAVNDQQLAGAIMKVGGTTYLWAMISVMFFRYVASQYRSGDARVDRAASAAAAEKALTEPVPTRRSPEMAAARAARAARAGRDGGALPTDGLPRVLTWDDVAEEMAKSPPAEP
jgi:putative membrane protein